MKSLLPVVSLYNKSCTLYNFAACDISRLSNYYSAPLEIWSFLFVGLFCLKFYVLGLDRKNKNGCLVQAALEISQQILRNIIFLKLKNQNVHFIVANQKKIETKIFDFFSFCKVFVLRRQNVMLVLQMQHYYYHLNSKLYCLFSLFLLILLMPTPDNYIFQFCMHLFLRLYVW